MLILSNVDLLKERLCKIYQQCLSLCSIHKYGELFVPLLEVSQYVLPLACVHRLTCTCTARVTATVDMTLQVTNAQAAHHETTSFLLS